MTISSYSLNERKLIESMGFGDIIRYTDIDARTVYKMMVEKAFENNIDGPHVMALRRACLGFRRGVNRWTQEFDDMIRF